MAKKKTNFIFRGGADFSVIKQALEKTGAALDKFKNDMQKSLNSVKTASANIGKVIAGAFAAGAIKNFVSEAREMYAETVQDEQKLATVMKATMGASNDAIQSVLDFAAAESKLGVVSAGAMTAAAQELATYLDDVDALKTAIPVLNNIATQQYGVNVTADQLQQTATMLGKVLDGQLGGLSRWGYSWTAAEEEILKTGTTLEKAATIAKVVAGSVGDMNYALAQTDVGRQKQLAEAFGDVKTEMGAAFNQIAVLFIPALRAVADWLAKIANLARQVSQLIANTFGGKEIQAQANAQKNLSVSAASAADAEQDLGKAVEKAGKQAKKFLAPFDEIIKVQSNIADGADDAIEALDDSLGNAFLSDDLFTGGIQAPVDTTQIEEQLKKVQDLYKRFIDWFKPNFTPVLTEAWEKAQPTIEKYRQLTLDIWSDLTELENPLKNWFAGDYTEKLKQSLSTALTVVNGFADTLVMVLSDTWNDVFSKWFEKFITVGLPAITNFSTQALKDFENFFNDTKKWFDSLWNDAIQPILPQIEQLGTNIAQVFWNTFTGVYDTLKTVFDDIINSAVKPFVESFFESILPIGTGLLNELVKTWNVLFTEVKKIFDLIWQDAVKPALDMIAKIWTELWESLKEFWDKWGSPIFDGIRQALITTGEVLQSIWNTILKPIFDNFMKTVDSLWTNHLKPFIDNFLDLVGELANAVLLIYNNAIMPIAKWLVETLGPVFTTVFNDIFNTVASVIGGIIDIASGIITIFKGIAQFLAGVFSGDIKKSLEGIKTIFEGFCDTLFAVLKLPINLIIDGLNSLMKGIANLFSSVVNIVVNNMNAIIKGVLTPFNILIDGINSLSGGNIKKLEFSIPSLPSPGNNVFQIPRLAKGTVAEPRNPYLAVIGDNMTEPEVVSPLSTMKKAFIEALSETGGGQDVNVTIQFTNDSDDLAALLAPRITVEQNGMTRQRHKSTLSV